MKKIIMATVSAACLALCAAVWLSAAPAEDVPATPSPPAVTAAQPEVLEAPEIKEPITTENEKDEASRPKAVHNNVSEPEPTANPIPPVTETQIIIEPEPTPREAPAVPEVQPTPESEPVADPAPSQAADTQPSDTVYVPGFGWLESQGSGEVIYAEDIYENGNKIGSMG